jgi:hypothetical protein
MHALQDLGTCAQRAHRNPGLRLPDKRLGLFGIEMSGGRTSIQPLYPWRASMPLPFATTLKKSRGIKREAHLSIVRALPLVLDYGVVNPDFESTRLGRAACISQSATLSRLTDVALAPMMS